MILLWRSISEIWIFSSFCPCHLLVSIHLHYLPASLFLYRSAKQLTCRKSMNASWRVSPWKPGTGSELANTEQRQKQKCTTFKLGEWCFYQKMDPRTLFLHWGKAKSKYNNHVEVWSCSNDCWNTKAKEENKCLILFQYFVKFLLTFTLNHIQVELLNCSHTDLFEFWVQQHLHKWCGQMLARWHASCLGNFSLHRQRQGEEEGTRVCKRRREEEILGEKDDRE